MSSPLSHCRPLPHFYSLYSDSKKVDYLLFVRTGIIPHPADYELESYSPKRGTAPNPKRPFFVFLLQVSGVDDRRRTLTPLALRYSILSESTLGINLFVLICAHSLSKEAVSELPSPHPDESCVDTIDSAHFEHSRWSPCLGSPPDPYTFNNQSAYSEVCHI